jgi:general secretion pathway protein E
MNAALGQPDIPDLTEVQLAAALDKARRLGHSALAVLEEECGLGPAELATALGRILDYRYVGSAELAGFEPAFNLLSSADATRRNCVLVNGADGLLVIIADPFDSDLRAWLEVRVSAPLGWAIAARADIGNYLSRHEVGVRTIDSAVVAAQTGAGSHREVENLSLASINMDSSPIVKLVHSTIFDALRTGASDIHLESTNAGLVVRYRVDGVLITIATVNGADVSEQVVSRLKVMSELDIAERRVPQDGRFKTAVNGRPIDFRVSIIPSVFGEDAVLRVLDKQALTDELHGLRLDALGFDPKTISRLRRLSALPYGMLLVTGPTGSGKTTTLYAAISETHTGSDKFVTIEDPVEYQLAGVLQIPVNEKKGLTFARGLRSILRHDPDKIMVGEIRDPETAQIAIQSALTGHLVFTTVHANNVLDVMGRFLHMGVDAYSFVSALSGILAQRLIRIVCEQCAENVRPPRALLDESGVSAVATATYNFRAGRGCLHCRGSGYRGRKAIGELLIMNDEIREAFVARVPVRQLKEMAVASGVRFIRDAAMDLVRTGETTLEEVNRVTTMA